MEVFLLRVTTSLFPVITKLHQRGGSLEFTHVTVKLIRFDKCLLSITMPGPALRDEIQWTWCLPCASSEFSNVSERKFLWPAHGEAKQYRNVRVWSRERFTAGPCEEAGGFRPRKTPNSLKGFSKAFLR